RGGPRRRREARVPGRACAPQQVATGGRLTLAVDELAEQRLLWCLRPEFDIQLARPRSRRSARARIASAVVPESVRPYTPSRARETAGGLVVTRSPNEE